jgi:hypothetical protein
VKQEGRGARGVKAKKGQAEKVEEVVAEVKKEEEQAVSTTRMRDRLIWALIT